MPETESPRPGRPLVTAFVILLLGLAVVSDGVAELDPNYRDELWIGDFDVANMRVDQAQTRELDATTGDIIWHTSRNLGQTFVPQSDFIARIDVRVNHCESPQPATFKLWKWEGAYGATTSATPLYTEVLDLQGPFPSSPTQGGFHDGFMLRHILPNVAVTRGEPYFFQIQRQVDFAIPRTETSSYSDGMMVELRDGQLIDRSDQDLAFIVYSGNPSTRTVSPLSPFPPVPGPSRVDPRAPSTPITKADYLDHLQRYPEALANSAHTKASWCAFHYRVSGDDRWARCAADSLRGEVPRPDGPAWFAPRFMAYWWIRDSSALDGDDHREIQELFYLSAVGMTARERGAGNRAMGHLFMFSAMLKLFPQDPRAADWQAYVDSTWDDWYQYRDVEENSMGYLNLWGEYLISYLVLNDRLSLLREPGVRAFFERYRDQVSPLGALPSYGDTGGWGYHYGGWVMLFEALAAQNNDGTFKWAAHQVYDYVRRYIKNKPLHEVESWDDLPRLALAYFLADDSVPEVEPPRRSRVTLRKEIARDESRRQPFGCQSHAFFPMTQTTIPDKLILNSRHGPHDLYALFDLVDEGGASHGHFGAPNLVGLTANDTVILNGPNTFERAPEDQNSLFLKKARGGVHSTAPVSDVTVTRFVENQDFTFAELSYKDPLGYGHDLKRQVFLVKNEFLWIRDLATFAQAMELSIGPLWGLAEAPFSNGRHWFDIGWDEPFGDADRWRNGDSRLLLYFAPQPGLEINWQHFPWKVRTAQPYLSSPPYTVFQRFPRLITRSGQRIHFNTLAVPHASHESGSDVAGRIKVLEDTDRRTTILYWNGTENIRASIIGSTPSLSIMAPGGKAGCIADCRADRDACLADVGTPGAPTKAQCVQRFRRCLRTCP